MEETNCTNEESLLHYEEKIEPIIVKTKQIIIDKNENPASQEIEPPDGGWGWVIAISCFVIVILGYMPLPVYSIIYSDILMDKNTSTTTSSLIFGASLFITNFSGIFASPLCTLLGYRKMSLLGNSLCVLGITLSAFATAPIHLFICFSLIYGIGAGMVIPISQFIIPRYFKKRRGLIMGLSMACLSVSLFLGPLLVGILQEYYGYKGATLILGGIMSHTIAASSLLHPVGWDKPIKKSITKHTDEIAIAGNAENGTLKEVITEEEQGERLISVHPSAERQTDTQTLKRIRRFSERSNISFQSLNDVDLSNSFLNVMDDKASSRKKDLCIDCTPLLTFLKGVLETLFMLKSHRMKIITLGYTLITPCYMNTNMLVPFLLKESGHSLEVSLKVLSISALGSLVVRIVISAVIDRLPFSTKHYFMIGTLCGSLATLVLTMVTDIVYFSIAMCIFGVGQGFSMIVISLMNIEFMGLEYLMPAFSMMMVSFSFSMALIVPLLGIIRDVSASYVFTMRIMSGIFLSAFLLWFFMPLAQRSDKKRNCYQTNEN